MGAPGQRGLSVLAVSHCPPSPEAATRDAWRAKSVVGVVVSVLAGAGVLGQEEQGLPRPHLNMSIPLGKW